MEKVKIMGVLNLTPDSFYDGHAQNLSNQEYLKKKIEELSASDIIDVGCESSRPGANSISIDSEIHRLSLLDSIIGDFNNCFSIDTYKYQIAERALKNGFQMVNDIYAGRYDDNKMFEVVANFNVPIVLMHMKGAPLNMQENIKYDSLIDDILYFFDERIKKAKEYGISENNIIIDPGIGFGKTFKDNFTIIKNIDRFKSFGHKLLIGLSRKNFLIYKEDSPIDRLSATITMNAISIINGANIIRVHDVSESIKMINALKQYASC